MLPGSTERILSVSGVADAIHIAVYYIGTILLEYQERNPGPHSGIGTYRQQPQGMQPQQPQFAGVAAPAAAPAAAAAGAAAPGSQTQQIFIPNSLVGASEFENADGADMQSLARRARRLTRSVPSRSARSASLSLELHLARDSLPTPMSVWSPSPASPSTSTSPSRCCTTAWKRRRPRPLAWEAASRRNCGGDHDTILVTQEVKL